uniref:Tyrosine-protein kinase ephrin type A/B receptor-like domain-containing protein n=1 Tax=Alexandrium monilatum TaxID=311494 RepID=A0A7S4T9G1_9DINO
MVQAIWVQAILVQGRLLGRVSTPGQAAASRHTRASGMAPAALACAACGAAALLLLARPVLGVAACSAGQGVRPGLGCGTCGPGTWSDGSSDGCTACAPGRWSGITGATEAAVCVPCPAGRWSDEAGAAVPSACKPCAMGHYGVGKGLPSEAACTTCPAGTFSGAQGATASDACIRCARGRYSNRSAAVSILSCAPCPAGRWSSKMGLSSHFLCEHCPAGSWAGRAGSISKSNCTLCPAGKWGGIPGQTDKSFCWDCPTGRWSSREGISSKAACVPCAPGKWSSAWGASHPFVCIDCQAGRAQPEPGMPHDRHCQPCPTGSFSSSPGSTACSRCQRGSWTNVSASRWCHACPAGKWTRVAGAVFAQRCSTCSGGLRCLGGSVALVEVEFPGFNLSGPVRGGRASAVALFVGRIAAACAVDRGAVVDDSGANASAVLGEAGLLRAYVMVPANASVNGLASRLYTSTFQSSMQEAASKAFGTVPTVFKVNVQPKTFEPLPVPTVTSTTAMTTGTTTSGTTATTAMQVIVTDLAARRTSFPWLGVWLTIGLLFVVGLLVAGRLASHKGKGACSFFRGEANATGGVPCCLPESDEELEEPEEPIMNTEASTPRDDPQAALPMLMRAARADAQNTPKAVVQPTAARAPARVTTIAWVNPPRLPQRGGQPVRVLHLQAGERPAAERAGLAGSGGGVPDLQR